MIKVEELVPLLQEALGENRDFKMPVRGTSMLPFIREGDAVMLTKPENLKKHDILFYRRTDGHYVLHRIFQVKKEFYVLMGDNQTQKEQPIYPSQAIAKVKAVVREGEVRPLKGFSYRCYLFFWQFRIVRKLMFPVTRRCAK